METFKEYIKNKRILLVGNSVEIMNYRKGGKLAKFIDDFDGVVVRFGKGLPEIKVQQKAVGKRTDVWVGGTFRLPMLHKEHIRKLLKGSWVLFNKNRMYLNRMVNTNDKRIIKKCETDPNFINKKFKVMWTDKELINIYREFGYIPNEPESPRPSTGFLTLLWFHRTYFRHYKQLNLIGFDFFAKSADAVRHEDTYAKPFSWHLPVTKGALPHLASVERSFALFLEKNMFIRWHKLSDLKEESLKYSNYLKEKVWEKTDWETPETIEKGGKLFVKGHKK
tara:strand:+ start:887 stop:1723 length:837 start_codon:yes stop_codon:yes gene_type:complete